VDETIDRRQLYIVGLGAGIFFLACFKSCDEVRYRTQGIAATAKVTNIVPSYNRFRQHTGYDVWYDYDNREDRKHFSSTKHVGVAEGELFSLGQAVEIEYLAGDLPASRFKSDRTWFWISVVLVSVGAFVVACVLWALNPKNRE